MKYSAILIATVATAANAKLMHTRETYEADFGEFSERIRRPALCRAARLGQLEIYILPPGGGARAPPSRLEWGACRGDRGSEAQAAPALPSPHWSNLRCLQGRQRANPLVSFGFSGVLRRGGTFPPYLPASDGVLH